MNIQKILLLALAVFTLENLYSQACTTLGQNPGSAFPICGSKDLFKSEVPLCGGKTVPSLCSDEGLTDINPYWYKFTCYTSGTLGFTIVPENLSDDYDWQLFDVSGHSSSDVFTDRSLFVACNWSGELGKTGTKETATSLVVCGGAPNPVYSKMPDLIAGHDYLLLISHFTNTQSGYTLSFGGGTADITDPKLPVMQAASGACDGNQVFIKLDKAMSCASIAGDGSDFELTGGEANVTGASSVFCSSGFTTDSIVVTLDKVLPEGAYSIRLKKGSDANTLLDDCDKEMAEASIPFTIHENVFAAFTYELKEGCVKDTVNFFHDGAHNIVSWSWIFDSEVSTDQGPSIIYNTSGIKNAQLVVANEFCTDTASEEITIPDAVKAAYQGPEIICSVDEAIFTDQSSGSVNAWAWNFGEGISSNQKNPLPFKYSRNDGEKTYRVSLTVTDAAGCKDSVAGNIVVVGNCNIVVPSAFTPNHDGKNDELFPTNAFNADNLLFRVYNRYGQIVFETRDWRKKWDGNVNGQPQGSGTYIWTLNYVLRTTGRRYDLKGTSVLIR